MTAKIYPFARPTAEPCLRDNHTVTLTVTIRPEATPPEKPAPLSEEERRRSNALLDETIARLREDRDA